jgi:hypothetical protein
MASRILGFIIFHVFIFMTLGCNAWAQESHGPFNLSEPITQISYDLRSVQAPECYTNLISISNILSNYMSKKRIPTCLLNILSSKNIIPLPADTSDLKIEVFIVARYIYSVNFDSYLLMVTKEQANIEGDKARDLYLINVKQDTLISICRVASHFSGIGLAMQSYSIYQGNDVFEYRTEIIASDVELVKEENKVKRKQDDLFSVKIVVNRRTGQISKK